MGALNDWPEFESGRSIADRIQRTQTRIAELTDILRDTRRGLALLPPESLEHQRGEQDVLLLEAERDGLLNLFRGLQDATRNQSEHK